MATVRSLLFYVGAFLLLTFAFKLWLLTAEEEHDSVLEILSQGTLWEPDEVFWNAAVLAGAVFLVLYVASLLLAAGDHSVRQATRVTCLTCCPCLECCLDPSYPARRAAQSPSVAEMPSLMEYRARETADDPGSSARASAHPLQNTWTV